MSASSTAFSRSNSSQSSMSDAAQIPCSHPLNGEYVLQLTEAVLSNPKVNPCAGSMQTGKLHDQVQKKMSDNDLGDLDGWLKDRGLSWNKFLRQFEGKRLRFLFRCKEEILLYGLSTSCDDPRLALGTLSEERILHADILYSRQREKLQVQVLELIEGLPSSFMSLDKVLAVCQRQVPGFSSYVPSKNALKELVAPRYRVKFGDLVPRYRVLQHQPYPTGADFATLSYESTKKEALQLSDPYQNVSLSSLKLLLDCRGCSSSPCGSV